MTREEGVFHEPTALFMKWRAERGDSLANRIEPPDPALNDNAVLTKAADVEVPDGTATLEEMLDRAGMTLTDMPDPFADIRCIVPGCRSLLTSLDEGARCRKHPRKDT